MVGFDSKNVGSYIYANKTTPGEFILEDLDYDTGISPLPHSESDGKIFDLQGRRIADSPAANGKLPSGIYIQEGRKKLVK